MDARTVRRTIQRRWLRGASARSWDIAGLSPSSFAKTLPVVGAAQAKEAQALGPWLPVLDLAIQWLSGVSIVLSRSPDPPLPKEKALQVPWSLIGAASHYAIALRHMVVLGFDSPARAHLRTLVELLLLCLAALDDPEFSEAFRGAHSDTEVKDFWHKRASPRKLHLRVQDIERKFGLPDDWIERISEWRTGEHAIMSQAVHLSFAASVLTVLSADTGDGDENRYGVFGHLSSNSERTLSYAARTIWHFCILGGSYLFDGIHGRGPVLPLDETDSVNQALVVTREVLMECVLDIWREFNADATENS